MIGLWLLKKRMEGVDDIMAAARSLNYVRVTTGSSASRPPADVQQPPIPPIVTVPPGDIATHYGNPPQDVSDAIKAYWPAAQWVNAASVSFLESGWRNIAELNTLSRGPCGTRYWFSDAIGWAQTEDSIGIFQINICAHGGTKETWYDPNNNARKAAELYASAGWSPWRVSAGRLGLL